jgi:hypothetical protein
MTVSHLLLLNILIVFVVHQRHQELSKRHVAALISGIVEAICCSL